MLPPLSTATVRPDGRYAPSMSAAIVMAPLGSTTSFAIEEKSHGATHRGVVHRHHFVDVLLMMRECEMPDLDGEQAVGNAARFLEPNRSPGVARPRRLWRPARLDADDACWAAN